MHEGSITISLDAQLSEVERLNQIARRFGELHEVPSRALYSLNLALDELVTNIILYGYEDAAGQKIDVRIEARPQLLIGSVEDSGREFDPLSLPPPDITAPLASRELGGLGIHLVRNLMDEVTYCRKGSKNLLTIRKRIR